MMVWNDHKKLLVLYFLAQVRDQRRRQQVARYSSEDVIENFARSFTSLFSGKPRDTLSQQCKEITRCMEQVRYVEDGDTLTTDCMINISHILDHYYDDEESSKELQDIKREIDFELSTFTFGHLKPEEVFVIHRGENTDMTDRYIKKDPFSWKWENPENTGDPSKLWNAVSLTTGVPFHFEELTTVVKAEEE